MDARDMNESAGGRVIGNYYEYDGDGRLICHWQTVATGGLCMFGTAQRLDAAPILVESRPTGSPCCPACRGTGRVMLLIRSRECQTCGGTGKMG
jgi:hypothetical protein